MGIRFSKEILFNNPSPEQKLWRAVIINAFDETLTLNSDRKSSLIKMNSHNWILSDNRDFIKVCDWDSYKKACKNMIVRFKTKQIAWKVYDIKYKKMLSEDNNIMRNRIRKNILMFRRSIIESEDELLTTALDSVVS
jgi:hypothetical protein